MNSDRDPHVPNADTTYNILRRQLLQENQGRCCYCMRTIEEGNTTLEHVIPNKTPDQAGYDKYQTFYSPEDWQKMVFSKAFLANPCWPYRAFPHTVAYENLIPSCNGKFAKSVSADIHARDDRESKCCNNKRGNEYVIPFVLNRQMVSEFKYHSNGHVVWPVKDANIQGDARRKLLEEHKETISRLNLNCPELVAIRRIWFLLSSLGKDCDAREKDRIIFFLTEDDALIKEERDMLNNFWSDNYWSLLSEYRYFNDRSIFA